ncbi:MAG: hypothetical protein LGB07_01075 [Sulfurovum sp.]|nr:hypothetical protein [Sulfurovum sp.]MCB4744240.1 hypothetical protein [Sulfurovum sp.]MCB4746512.1 hypothetical protein [Sulfurovum sp.]MCB4747791.1 hypothetical protein [Sulfurovum sp.]MCB4749052.1 hypothetical protein [Sulfurovum sp.]
MSKFTSFIVFNIVVYVLYGIIDKLFTLLSLYSNPKLGESLSVMPTTGDIILIFINILFSSLIGLYLVHKIKKMIDL